MITNGKRGRVLNILVLVLFAVVLAGIFFSETGVVGNTVWSEGGAREVCFEGTEYGECSPVKPKYCDDGSLKPDCGKCGCPSDQACLDNGKCIPKCGDGTLYGECSEDKPLYCNKGNLLENCFKCGCYDGGKCEADGTCSGVRTPRCDDGTIYYQCSKEKPKYCDEGSLIDKCSLCRCPEGKDCENERCVEEKEKVIEKSPIIKDLGDTAVWDEGVPAPEAQKEKNNFKSFLKQICEFLKLDC